MKEVNEIVGPRNQDVDPIGSTKPESAILICYDLIDRVGCNTISILFIINISLDPVCKAVELVEPVVSCNPNIAIPIFQNTKRVIGSECGGVFRIILIIGIGFPVKLNKTRRFNTQPKDANFIFVNALDGNIRNPVCRGIMA